MQQQGPHLLYYHTFEGVCVRMWGGGGGGYMLQM